MEVVDAVRNTERVEEHGLGEIPETAGSGHGAAVIFPAYEGSVQTRSNKLSGVQWQTC